MSYTHLSLQDRTLIEIRLNERKSISAIAKELNRSKTTITNEIKNHIENSLVSSGRKYRCIKERECYKHHLNSDCKSYMNTRCASCKKCYLCCKEYEPLLCEKRDLPPYVCNGCEKSRKCRFEKHMYRAEYADMMYRSKLVESRKGFNLTDEQLAVIDEKVKPLIKQGHSPYHIIQVLGEEINISEATLRRIIADCAISVRNIDLRRQVRTKQRKKPEHKIDKAILSKAKEGRSYQEFINLLKDSYFRLNYVQMDCVEGLRTDNCVLLTLFWGQYNIQVALILESHTKQSVVAALDKLETSLGQELFAEMFPCILTDNGHEFEDIEGMERSILGGKRTTVYFCEPRQSQEKGGCERNHELIRYVIPKGNTLDCYNQADITLMMNHINSYIRKELGNKSPYDLAEFMNINKDFFILLGLEKIPSKEINLTPTLFPKEKRPYTLEQLKHMKLY